MKIGHTITWSEWNQRQLVNALADVRAELARAAGEEVAPAKRKVPSEQGAENFISALDRLSDAFRLSPFERALVLLCAGPELEAGFGALIARLHGEPRRTTPTFQLALGVLPGAHWSALTSNAPLRRWRLIELRAGESFTTSPLRLDERVLHFLCGVEEPDESLRGLVRLAGVPPVLAPAHQEAARRIADTWVRPAPRPVVMLGGGTASDQRAVAAAGCAACGLRMFVLRAVDVPDAPAERDALARLWERESVMNGAVLLLDVEEADSALRARVAALLTGLAAPVVVGGGGEISGFDGPVTRIDLATPLQAERRAAWFAAVGPERAAGLNGVLDAIAQQFQLDIATIRELGSTPAETFASRAGKASSARRRPTFGKTPPAANTRHNDGEAHALWNACRLRTRGPLEALAQRIEAKATWEDLVLPPEQERILREIATHVRQRGRVYETWGFAARQSRGLGISALFHGPSGTGKTLAAEVLANELRLDLFRIDLSAVVNKYIGETEKNLRRVFDAADAGGAILLFDEADALFGKRSEVKDSHDRYANIEVSYLLQRVEAYRGLAILTTNQRQALDQAFLRRLRFAVSFPFPDAAQRAEIWRKVFPRAMPAERLDPIKLARLNVSGGSIRNIAMHAAFLAADDGGPVRMTHLAQAARSECTKIERPLSDAEIGGWA